MLKLFGNDNYIRLYPNIGFAVSIWPHKRLHWCQGFGFGILKPHEFCARYRKGNWEKFKNKEKKGE